MSNDKPVDFNQLAKEAVETVYNPRAKPCWFWLHKWTMWESEDNTTQTRRCVNCGKIQSNSINGCNHDWIICDSFTLSRGDMKIGMGYNQYCIKCGEIRLKEIIIDD